ncbi:S-adenosyl-L-methionine-dependent methyltransferase [Hyaloraphidium curvatum]|nr:S-adenosyl-L-methionine-dependent methyltransferase [Hyaloraphidium curvatum]
MVAAFVELAGEADPATLDLLSTALGLTQAEKEPPTPSGSNKSSDDQRIRVRDALETLQRALDSPDPAPSDTLASLLRATFHNPSWLFSSGLAFLHAGDNAAPADAHHNLVALWTKNCILALGMLPDPAPYRLLTHMLPPGRARRFVSPPLVDPLFGPGTRAAGRPTAERMAFVTARLEQALGTMPPGPRQIAVVGGGFEVIPLRAAEMSPGIRGFELDLPHVVRAKALALRRLAEELSLDPGSMPVLIGADLLEHTPAEALLLPPFVAPVFPGSRQHVWDPRVPTLFLVEAVLMYLPPPRGAEILRSLASAVAAAPGSALIMWDHIATDAKEGEGMVEAARRAIEGLGLRAVHVEAGMEGFAAALAVAP